MGVTHVMGSSQSRQRRCQQQKAARQPAAQALPSQGAGKPDRLVVLVRQGKRPAAGAAAESSHGSTTPQAPKQQAAEGQAARQQASQQPEAGQRAEEWPVDEQQVIKQQAAEQQLLEVHVNEEQVNCCEEPIAAWSPIALLRQGRNVHASVQSKSCSLVVRQTETGDWHGCTLSCCMHPTSAS